MQAPNLQNHIMLNEGGRKLHFFFSYLLASYYGTGYKKWNLPLIAVINSRNNDAQWRIFAEHVEVYDDIFYSYLRGEESSFEIEKEMGLLSENFHSEFSSFLNTGSKNSERLMEVVSGVQNLAFFSGLLRVIDRGAQRYFDRYPVASFSHQETIEVISISERELFLAQEERALLIVALEAKQRGITTADDELLVKPLLEIHERFSSLITGYFSEPSRTMGYYHAFINSHIQDPESALKILDEKNAESAERRRKFLQACSAEQKLAAALASHIVYLKDLYKHYINRIIVRLEKEFFVPLADECQRNIEDLLSLTYDELIKAHETGVTPSDEILGARREHCILIGGMEKVILLTAEEAADFEQQWLLPKEEERKIFKGRCACKGQVRGRARIVLGVEDFNKVEDGDIIVVRNTSPDYVPILKSVSAIIAEDGGITAHVAVISREMKIPTVVGILHAPLLFKDGDMVEVDADRGIITISE